MEDNIIRCKVKVERQFFPKNNIKVKQGDFAILSVGVLEVLEGEPDVNKWGTISITGNRCEYEYGEIYTLVAKEVQNEKFGKQYSVISFFQEIDLTDVDNQKIFLGRIITPKQVESLYDCFENPIAVIEQENIMELCKAKGIGVTHAMSIIEKYNDNKDFGTAYVELDKYGLTTKMIQKLCKTYGDPNTVIDKIKSNPYILADEVDGVGWNKADDIALKAGHDEFSVNRVAAFIKYYLDKEANNGNSYVYMDDVIENIEENIDYNLSDELISGAFMQLNRNNEIWRDADTDRIGLERYYRLENNIANEITRLAKAKNNFNIASWDKKIKVQQLEQGWEYTEQQLKGIEETLKHNVVLISGYAGTGKTSIVLGMLKALSGYSFAQTALSGKASVNLSEATGEEGFTIHRLLGFNPDGGFLYTKENQLKENIIILDEVSMPGGELIYSLLKAIKTGSKLIMLGDIGQLESIGVANVMHDLMKSGVIAHVNLTEIHRQAKKSAIKTESLRVYNSEQIVDSGFTGVEVRGELQDLKLEIYKNKSTTPAAILDNFKNIYENESSNIMDIQVIVPTNKRGDSCTSKINKLIQSYLRDKTAARNRLKKGSEKSIEINEGNIAYVGDKVINLKNNYKTLNDNGIVTPIFNGNLGIIIEICDNGMIIVDFEKLGKIIIPNDKLRNIDLGYAITVHKSQGAGFKYVIGGLDYSHYTLLTKELVYTMMSRAKKLCILCAENKALRHATKNSNVPNKQTFLKDMLIEKIRA